MTVVGYYYSR